MAARGGRPGPRLGDARGSHAAAAAPREGGPRAGPPGARGLGSGAASARGAPRPGPQAARVSPAPGA